MFCCVLSSLSHNYALHCYSFSIDYVLTTRLCPGRVIWTSICQMYLLQELNAKVDVVTSECMLMLSVELFTMKISGVHKN